MRWRAWHKPSRRMGWRPFSKEALGNLARLIGAIEQAMTMVSRV